MSTTVVHVKNISHQTSEKEVRNFFSFCGKITSISVTPTSDAPDSTKSATVTFEKETAAKTALLLDNTQLGPSQVHVSSASSIGDLASSAATSAKEAVSSSSEDDSITQEDKPRSRIVAEYLAHGYVLSDTAIEKAIALDNKHGVSTRFTNALKNFDQKYHATDKAKGLDASYGISDRATTTGTTVWQSLHSYFEKAMGTPTGQKLAGFYTMGDKQVRDIHTEARRLADLKKSGMQRGADGKTTCDCQGESGDCPCKVGECTCSGCGKSESKGEKAGGLGEHTATGKADVVADSTPMAPLGEKQV
ncbi:hypothetical protein MMC30_008031 [Trapelia coarctata]|nr:hypothetical protein [Trapelia coarctata]